MNHPALLVAGHGTRDPEGVAGFAALIEELRRRGEAGAVDGGFIELSRPPLQDAVATLVAAGHRHHGVVPLVLVAAGHAKGDIPASLARERRRHPGLALSYGRPLGPHPALQDLLAARIDAALDGAPREGTTVLLVGRGSTDPDANAETAKVARLLWEGRGYDAVETSFISLAAPGVPAALDRIRRLGARRVVLAPYFLFRGVLPDRARDQARAFAAGAPGLDLRVAAVLGDDGPGRAALADLVLERWREALAGDIRMGCDTCLYRVPLPGFADRVGAPQTPHDHPDDPAHAHAHPHAHPRVPG